MSTVFSFDVEVSTHDLLKEGITAGRFFGAQQNWHRIVVSVTDEDCQSWKGYQRDPYMVASEIALSMAWCHGYPTAIYYRE
jgi:hypothetical protein